jgi:hypothetical protein
MSGRIIDTPVGQHAAVDAAHAAVRATSEYGTAVLRERQRTRARAVGSTCVVLLEGWKLHVYLDGLL